MNLKRKKRVKLWKLTHSHTHIERERHTKFKTVYSKWIVTHKTITNLAIYQVRANGIYFKLQK